MRGLAKSVAADFRTRTNATIAGLLALAGVTGMAGGFEEAEPEEVVTASEVADPVAQPEELEIAPLTIQVQRAYVLDGARVVHIRLTNTAERPIYAMQWHQAFNLEESAADKQPKFQKTDVRLTSDDNLESAPLPDNQVLNRVCRRISRWCSVAMAWATRSQCGRWSTASHSWTAIPPGLPKSA